MGLDTRALAWSMAVVWGGGLFVVSLLNQMAPGYGEAFLEWSASLYPGYTGPNGLGSVVLVTLYGLLDGAVFGWLLAWLYNVFAGGAEGKQNSGVE